MLKILLIHSQLLFFLFHWDIFVWWYIYTIYSTIYTTYSTVHTTYSTIYTIYSSIYTMYSTIYTIYSIIYTIYSSIYTMYSCPVGWGCRIHWLHLWRRVRPHPTSVLIYDTKQSDGEAPIMPSLPGPLWPGVVAPDSVLSIGWIELSLVHMLNWIVWIRTVWLNWIAWKKCFWQLNCVLTFKVSMYVKLNCLK